MTPMALDIKLVRLRNRGYRWLTCAIELNCSPAYCRERYEMIARDPRAYGIPDKDCEKIEKIKAMICECKTLKPDEVRRQRIATSGT